MNHEQMILQKTIEMMDENIKNLIQVLKSYSKNMIKMSLEIMAMK